MEDRTIIEWDKDDINALGLLKIDILALGMLTCIRKAFALLAAHRGQHLTVYIVNERSKLTRVQRLILTRLSDGKAPRRAALI